MADAALLEIKDLCVSSADQNQGGIPGTGPSILDGVSLTVEEAMTSVIVGSNGSGKSTLAAVLLGSPSYLTSAGTIRFRGDNIDAWPTDVRAKAGMFLGFQGSQGIKGILVSTLIQSALSARGRQDLGVLELRSTISYWIKTLGLDPAILDNRLDGGRSSLVSTGTEILQMLMLEPELAVLDLTDAAESPEALELLANGIELARVERPTLGTLIMSRDNRLLDYLEPDVIHVLTDGRLTATKA